MPLDKLTSRLQAALAAAQSLAVGRDHPAVEPLHLLAALLEDGGVDGLLQRAGVDGTRLRADVDAGIENLPRIGKPTGEVAASQQLARVLNLADRAAQKRGDSFVSSELAVAAMGEAGGPAQDALRAAGFDAGRFRQAVDSARDGEAVRDAGAEDAREALAKYTVDLTARAEEGKLDPVIGRDEEIAVPTAPRMRHHSGHDQPN